MGKNNKKSNTEEFVLKARSVHGNLFDYSKVNYTNNHTHVIIKCTECGRDFTQQPHNHLQGNGCPYCKGRKISERKMKDGGVFIKEAKLKHGDRFDYSLVEYKGVDKKVKIICREHNFLFEQTPYLHLNSKHCCPICEQKVHKKIKFGVGLNDLNGYEKTQVYRIWNCMLERCYRSGCGVDTYIDCFVCDEWHVFSNFKKWFDENYVEGYHIDKDLLIKGNKVYSPETCCFLPKEINAIFKKYRKNNGIPTGVRFRRGKYTAVFQHKTLKTSFDVNECFLAYKTAKENYVKNIAQEYYNKGLIEKRVYDAMMYYNVEFYD